MTAVTARARLVCDDVEPLLSPFVDGELLEDDRAAVRGHVQGCPSCRGRVADLQRMKAALALAGQSGRDIGLPDELLARVKADVSTEARKERRARVAGLGVAAGAAAAVAVLVVAIAGREQAPAAAGAPVTPAVVAAVAERHELELPVDVASPDPRRVQEFLAARTGHSLVVPRLEQHGWGLQGGRIVDVDKRRGAQLVYRGGYGQRLSVVVLPDPDGLLDVKATLAAVAKNGLHVRMVPKDGSLYSFVSDLDDDRLATLSGVLER